MVLFLHRKVSVTWPNFPTSLISSTCVDLIHADVLSRFSNQHVNVSYRYVEERSFKRFAEACLEDTIVIYMDPPSYSGLDLSPSWRYSDIFWLPLLVLVVSWH